MHIRPCLVIKIQNVLNPDMDKKDNKLSTTTKKKTVFIISICDR